MSRRFLTAEDVHRAAGREIVVDETTVVTPQAQEAAESAGVVIRTGSGPYAPPAPDRGPDAELSARSLPHMPEPPDDPHVGTGIVVTAVGRNRPGVLAEITSALGDYGASVENISQKTVDGYFHLVLTIEAKSEHGFGDLKQCLECLGGQDDYVVRVMHERVFRFMHRV